MSFATKFTPPDKIDFAQVLLKHLVGLCDQARLVFSTETQGGEMKGFSIKDKLSDLWGGVQMFETMLAADLNKKEYYIFADKEKAKYEYYSKQNDFKKAFLCIMHQLRLLMCEAKSKGYLFAETVDEVDRIEDI